MAKRFTDTDKWKKPFIRGLQGAYKLLWFYICDDCDHAGIWHVDIEVAKIRTGQEINEEDAIKFFAEKIQVFDNGAKWFIPSFIEFQYPSGLSPANKAHGGVLKILEKYDLLKKEFKPLTSPLQGDKDMDKDKEEGNGLGKGKNPAQFPTMISHGGMEINDDEIQKVIEVNKGFVTQQVNSFHVLQWWASFKIINFDGTNFYENDHEIKKHFLNWAKFQKIPNNIPNGKSNHQSSIHLQSKSHEGDYL
jgi:hypothetical protein